MVIHPALINVHPDEIRDEAEKLTKDFFEATKSMGLANMEIAAILGVSEPTVSRAKKKDRYFSRSRAHQWAVAELLIRAKRELTRIYQHPRKEKHWFVTYNHLLAAFPIELIQRYEGLIEVVRHLEGREVYKKEEFKR